MSKKKGREVLPVDLIRIYFVEGKGKTTHYSFDVQGEKGIDNYIIIPI